MLKFDRDHPYVFISYKSDDREVIQKNVDYLQTVYGLNLWYDADLTAGRNWDDEAQPILVRPNCQAVLFFASELALMSPNVLLEIKRADYFGKPIIPINFSQESFHSVVTGSISRKYQDSNWDGVKNALDLVENYLPPAKTFLYLHQENYYPKLIQAIQRIIPQIVVNSEEEVLRLQAQWLKKEHDAAARVSTAAPGPQQAAPQVSTPPQTAPTPQAAPAPEVSTAPAEDPDKTVPDTSRAGSGRGRGGDELTVTIYGQTSTGNQAAQFVNIVQAVLTRHTGRLDGLVARVSFLSHEEYMPDPERPDLSVPTFRQYRELEFPSMGRRIFVNINLSFQAKCQYIADLLYLCGEPNTVVTGIALPPPGKRLAAEPPLVGKPPEAEEPEQETPEIGGVSLSRYAGTVRPETTLDQFRALACEPDFCRVLGQLRRDGERFPRQRAIFDYAMLALLGGCNAMSHPYQQNYYDMAVATGDGKRPGAKRTADWTWSSNARKVVGLEKSGRLNAEFNDPFEQLAGETTLAQVREDFVRDNAPHCHTRDNAAVARVFDVLFEVLG